MDLTDIHTIRRILGENKIKPNKRLGQNFIVAKPPLIRMIESAQIKTDDIVVEIGPGLGTLTQELAKRAKLVLAVEKDYELCEWLRRYFKGCKNVKIIHDDILKFPISNFPAKSWSASGRQFPNKSQISNVENSKLEKGIPRQAPQSGGRRNDNQNQKSYTLHATRYKVVANLPYQITSPVLRKFLTSENPPTMMILMVQKEVAERICAKPGNSERGFLTVMVEFYCGQVYPERSRGAEIVDYVSRDCFWPSPDVDSAIIKVSVNQRFDSKISVDPLLFFRLVKAGFSQKRRQIHHPLAANLHLSKPEIYDILKKAGIRPEMRAEELSLEEWIKLYKVITIAETLR